MTKRKPKAPKTKDRPSSARPAKAMPVFVQSIAMNGYHGELPVVSRHPPRWTESPSDFPGPGVSADSWKDFFGRFGGDVAARPSAADIHRAIYFWQSFPVWWAETLAAGEDTVWFFDTLLVLEMAHKAAERIIMSEAKRRGAVVAAVARSGELCRRAMYDNIRLFKNWLPEDISAWPGFLACAKRWKVKPEDLAAIRAAEDVITDLEAALEEERTDGAAVGGPAQDAYYPPVYYKPYKIKPSSLRAARARGDIKVRPAKPGSGRHHYCDLDVRKLWPDKFAPPSGIPQRQNATSSATERHNA